MVGGVIGSPTWMRISRTVGGSVIKAMIRIWASQSGQWSAKYCHIHVNKVFS